MKKAFKSSTVQDQQVVSKSSIPNPVADVYNQSDKPPPLDILTPYRYEGTKGQGRRPGSPQPFQSGEDGGGQRGESVVSNLGNKHLPKLSLCPLVPIRKGDRWGQRRRKQLLLLCQAKAATAG